MKILFFIVPFFFILLPEETNAQSHWSLELHGGNVYNLPVPLIIRQQNYPELKLTARYHTEAFTLPVYWDIRIGRWQNDKSWELELIHHKLYLTNTTPEVQKFNISHGFNMLFLNRGFDRQKFHYRFGAGIVLAHPESKIRGKEFGSSVNDFDMGYFLTGPVANLSIGKRFRLNKHFFINAETKTTIGYCRIQIEDGNAGVYHVTFHLTLGIGYNFYPSK